MERQKFGFTIIFSLIVIFGLASFAMCVAAEFKRSKVRPVLALAYRDMIIVFMFDEIKRLNSSPV